MKRRQPGNEGLAHAYLRVSTDGQEHGIGAQRTAITAWAKAHNVTVLGWHEDPGVSGTTPADKRKALLRALAALVEDGAGLLLVARRDRIGRERVVVATIERLVRERGAKVLAVEGLTGDEATAEGRLLNGIADSFSEYERSLIAARTKAALAVKRANGEATGGRSPFGWRHVVNGGGIKRLVENHEEQATLAKIRTLREIGLSFARLAAHLNEAKVPARGGRWHATTLQRILGRS